MTIKIASYICGSGPDLLLLHGWGGDSTSLLGIAKRLTGFRCHCLDLPGFGATQEPPTAWGTADYAACVEAYMSEQGLDRPIVIAHSFGGRIAIRLAAAGKTSKLVLTGAAGLPVRKKGRLRVKTLIYHLGKRTAAALTWGRAQDAVLDKLRSYFGSPDYRAASSTMRKVMVAVLKEDLTPLLGRIPVPTLLLWGALDTATPVEHCRIMQQNIPDARTCLLEKAGHFCFLEQPLKAQQSILEFLS